jgi:Flp pilus assembly protein TadB
VNTALLAALWVGVACAAAMWAVRPPAPPAALRVRPYTAVTRASLGLPPDVVRSADASSEIVLGPLRDAARAISRLIEARADEAIARRLYQAGRDDDVDAYRLRQVARGAAAGVLFGAVAMFVRPSPIVVLGLAVAGFVFGASRVRAELDRAVEQRAERMQLELATVNQLLALHVRSGAGPIQAVQRLVDRGQGALVDELRDVITWVRAGVREPEAFRRAAELTPCREAARTYQLFAAGAERGSDLASGLLAVSEDLRDARREAIRRAGVRRRAAMLGPTIGILAPIMLVFVAAPLPSIVLGNR